MKKYSLLIILTVCQLLSIAQLKSADKKFDKLAYSAAIPKYEKALKKDSTNGDTWLKLGESYRMTRDNANAERAYAHAVKSNNPKPEATLYYAEALMQNEKYAEAKTQLDKYIALAPADTRGKNLAEGIANMAAIKAKEGVYTVKKTNLNSGFSDFSPTVFNGGIVFTSNRKNVNLVRNQHSWTGEQFYRLYEAKGSEANFSTPVLFAESMHTKLHDGPVCFNNTGSQMYFTRNNIENGEIRKDANEIIRLKIFYANWSDNKWGIDVPFQYNSDQYSCAHPSLSADATTLYFSSDMPGGSGGMDIWSCAWNGTSWGTPSNLGTNINTKGNEVFPAISSDGTLLYSSDGLAGLGGLDICMARNTKGSWSRPENMGSPINSSDDDFGISYNSTNNTGYFSSNRKAQGKNDDIYYFTKKCTNVDVTIIDENSQLPLTMAAVKVMENGIEKETITTDETGKFNMCLNPSLSYEFIATKQDYSTNKSSLSSTDLSAAVSTGTTVKVPLKKNLVKATGRIYNADDKTPVANQPVTLTNITTGELISTNTDAQGIYNFDLALNNAYMVKTVKKDCGDASETFNTNNIIGEKTLKFDLPLLCKGDIIKIDDIYYDYNKFNIRPDAAVELDKVVALLNKYPGMKIELRSHTDARGKDAYNMKLSDNRAKSAVEYIISKGISATRLVAKGYGETELLNICKNDVECDDKMHEQNRRTEFKILQM